MQMSNVVIVVDAGVNALVTVRVHIDVAVFVDEDINILVSAGAQSMLL